MIVAHTYGITKTEIDNNDLYRLALRCKMLTSEMLARLGRLPDKADYHAAMVDEINLETLMATKRMTQGVPICDGPMLTDREP